MAYSTDDFLFTVRGTLASGEIFANNWAGVRTDGGAAAQDFGDALHDFYDTLAAVWMPNDTTITSCASKHLSSGITTELSWATITGANTQEPLPNQLGIRVSLFSGTGPTSGGPFLPGWAKQTTDTGGLVTTDVQDDIIAALEAMVTTLGTVDWALGIQSPTAVAVRAVTSARVGRRWDVIRKRANDVSESYVTTDFT